MVKLEFDGTCLHIPSSWEDIKLCDYEQWFMAKPETRLEQIRFIADVCKIDANILLNSPVEVFNLIVEYSRFIFDHDYEPSSKVVIDGETYSVSFSDKLTLGEYIDIDETMKSESRTKISEILAIVCRPAGEDYETEKAEIRKELFRQLPCDKALPLVAFFLHKKKESETILHHYSKVAAEVNQFLEDTENFVRAGDGIKSLPIWQKIRYIFLMRSLKRKLSKFSDSSFISKTEITRKKNNRIF